MLSRPDARRSGAGANCAKASRQKSQSPTFSSEDTFSDSSAEFFERWPTFPFVRLTGLQNLRFQASFSVLSRALPPIVVFLFMSPTME